MDSHIEQTHFLNPLFSILDETFENHHGIYLDAHTSLFETLEKITAEQASIPVGGKCASLGAQVAHIVFYMEVLERNIVFSDTTPADWGETWRSVGKVSQSEWDAIRESLHLVYGRLDNWVHSNVGWTEDSIGGAMAIVVHTAYHLGEIRQALCFFDGANDG
ncbi:MAG: hypothetical protein NTW32_15145 [Chloroflexi bacterium]|nr:hypothetical protein [Chloroflexota bacterium]